MNEPADLPKRPGEPAGPGVAPGADPTMDDILASIRRILNEDSATEAPLERREEVLVLDDTMMVSEPKSNVSPPSPAEAPAAPAPVGSAASAETVPPGASAKEDLASRLIAPAAAAAAAAAVGGLVKRLSSERSATVHRGGPTIEDLVREELRPLLKAWLDANLPTVVERVVHAEIERVLGRAAP